MPKYTVKRDFSGALRGCYVKHFTADTVVQIDDQDLEAVALNEGWIAPYVEQEKSNAGAPKNKAAKAAPKNKAAAE